MPSVMRMPSGSKWKSVMTNGSFECGSAMMEKALTRGS